MVTFAPAGVCCTLSNLSLTPEAVCVPAIRTTGNGCMSRILGLTTVIVSVAMLEKPLASVTSRRTT
jgi:hypothetical protein